MPKKQLEDKLKRHVHEPAPKQFFEIVEYQCGCGSYFAKEQYLEYCKKHELQPILAVEELRKSRDPDL
ncbi:MAG: hypothetical protein V1886_03830 [archaeon]